MNNVSEVKKAFCEARVAGAEMSADHAKNKMWYRFYQSDGTVLDILVESWIGLAEYVSRLQPVKIERIP